MNDDRFRCVRRLVQQVLIVAIFLVDNICEIDDFTTAAKQFADTICGIDKQTVFNQFWIGSSRQSLLSYVKF